MRATIAAVTGEAALLAAVFDIESTDMPPGAPVFGDQIMNALDGAGNVNYWLIGAALVLLVGFIFAARWWLKKKGF